VRPKMSNVRRGLFETPILSEFVHLSVVRGMRISYNGVCYTNSGRRAVDSG